MESIIVLDGKEICKKVLFVCLYVCLLGLDDVNSGHTTQYGMGMVQFNYTVLEF